MFGHVFCDFDGTLVDTSDGILKSLQTCIDRAGVSVLIEPSQNLIGPPLRSMIGIVIGPDHPALSSIETAFRSQYDGQGYLMTAPFPGIHHALRTLRDNHVRLHIVSNKRLIPVRRILDSLGWADYFDSVNTLDSTVDARSKSDVVSRLLSKLAAPLNSTIMIGDSLDDFLAARDNDIAFAWASWGYGRDPCLRSSELPLATSEDIVSRVLAG